MAPSFEQKKNKKKEKTDHEQAYVHNEIIWKVKTSQVEAAGSVSLRKRISVKIEKEKNQAGKVPDSEYY